MLFRALKVSTKYYYYINCFQHLIIIINAPWALQKHIRMISERSRDTEDWSNNAEIVALPSQD